MDPDQAPRISVALLTRDEAAHLPACLHSVAALAAPPAGELVIVLDSRASAAVEAIARRATPHVSREPFVNFSAQRNRALERCRGEWVFFIDPDERLTPALAAEIHALIAAGDGIGGGWVPRRNRMFGHAVRHAGWWPDYQLRLLRRAGAHYDEGRAVHEVAQVVGRTVYLREPLVHYNYATWAQFAAKQRAYAAHDAAALAAQGVRARPQNFVLQPLREFRRRYITLAGWRDGPLGLLLAGALAYYNLRMYLALARRAGLQPGRGGPPQG
jgi:glycosyltransferase involved in cell wall biosynthesis